MGSAKKQGELWNQAPENWAYIQEPHHNPLFEAMLNATEVSEGTRFLDVGCGGGGASLLAAERGAKVSGLDAAGGLINVARERIPSGDFRVGDLQYLPFEDDSFEVGFAANSIQYAADRVAALRELKRVCVSGGRVTVGLFAPPEKVAFNAIQRAVRSTLPEPPKGKVPYELSAPGKLEALFEEAGLQIIESGEVDCPQSIPDFETYWRGHSSAGPFRNRLRIVGEEKLRAVTSEALEPFRKDDGSYSIGPNIFKYVVAST